MKWQEPPATRGRTDHKPIAAALRSRPGEWALIIEAGTQPAASSISSGRYPAYSPPGSFEATARKRRDGLFDIYARYVGGSDV